MILPVFIVTGFLDSGKTGLVKDTLMEQEWIEDGLTLVLCCEEGEEEYDEVFTKKKNMKVLEIEDISQMTGDFFKACERNYHPAQLVIEYNGMWKLQDLMRLNYPRNWELQGVYSTVNGETLESYLLNMRNVLMEQLTESELVIVNRCPEGLNRAAFRRALKLQNPGAQVIFEDQNGKIIPPDEDDLPYDCKAPVIEIEDDDFGIWYADAYEHPEHYLHKEIHFKAQVKRPKGMPDAYFVPVRKIMTCCEDDVRLFGYPCKLPAGQKVPLNRWIDLKVTFEYESVGGSRKQPCLHFLSMTMAEKPKEEIVTLG